MRNLFTITLLLLVFNSGLFSQVIEEKVTRFNGPANREDIPRRIVSDAFGNTYVTGMSEGIQTGYDYLTIKYDNNGDIVWTKRYNGTGNGYDEALGVAVDVNGNVFVTGRSAGLNSMEDCVTIMYNSAGVEQWVNRYNGAGNGNDRGSAVGVDGMGNCYIGGAASTGLEQTRYLTIKYDASGNLVWSKVEEGADMGWDYIDRVKVTGTGEVFVTGNMYRPGSGQDIAVIKYSTVGVEQWRAYYTGAGSYIDRAYSIITDYAGNVLVTGESFTNEQESEYITLKYDQSGNELWARRYDGPGAGIDYANLVCSDGAGNAYVAGSSWGDGTHFDYCLIKYSPSGDVIWLKRYNGPVDLFDCINGMALDNQGNVCITGRSFGGYGLTNNDFYTMKYTSDGDLLWEIRYNSGPNSSDYGANLAVDQFGNVFVTGWSDGGGNMHDFVLIKYVDNITSLTNSGSLPEKYSLHQNYPNPFNPSTKIKFDIPKGAPVKLKVYDMLGQEVAELVNENLNAGTYEYDWNGEAVSSGVYFYKLETEGFIETKRMMLVK